MTLYVSKIALLILYVKRTRRIILSSLKCLAVPIICTLLHTHATILVKNLNEIGFDFIYKFI